MTFKSKIKSDEYRTPFWFFRQLNARFNFTLDSACNQLNRKVERHDLGEYDGLALGWKNERVFCNPPFSQKALWMEKMNHDIMDNGCPLTVMLLPFCQDTKAFNKYIRNVFYWQSLPYRINFLDENNEVVKGNTSGTLIVYGWKPIEDPTKRIK